MSDSVFFGIACLQIGRYREQVTTELKMKTINTNELKHLKVEFVGVTYIACLVDASGLEIVKGYGDTVIDAMNDLHSNLI